jgi:hypothetical protein
MTKASRQDVEMLQKLVVEFHDELEALGVRVDEMEGKVNKLDERLGGWKLSGRLRLDVINNENDEPDPDTIFKHTNFRIEMERFFGEEEQFHFFARIDTNTTDDRKTKKWNEQADDPIRWSLFYVDMPFFMDTTLTVGKFDWDLEGGYRMSLPTIGEQSWGAALTDQRLTGFGIEKQFGLGNVRAYVSKGNSLFGTYKNKMGDTQETNSHTHEIDVSSPYSAWQAVLAGKFQFNEQFGFDLGVQYYAGDNAGADSTVSDTSFDNMWTIWAGLRFDFNENIGFNGIFYSQQKNGDVWDGIDWVDADYDSAKLWKVAVAVKQDALKFTSLWLEYGQADAGFMMTDHFLTTGEGVADLSVVPSDLKFWKIGLGQEWNEKWATRLFYSGYSFDVDYLKAEWGLGIQYTMNSNVKFDLAYTQAKYDVGDDERSIRLRTQVTF